MNAPNPVLIARALHFLELAKLQLENGNPEDAGLSITTAVEYLRKVELS